MPLDTEIIDTEDALPFEAGARFFARIAYPTPSERNLRDQFYSALVRWAVGYDALPANEPLLVRPMHFRTEEILHDGTWRRGFNTLTERYTVADHIVIPILQAAHKGRDVTSKGLPVNFGNLVSDAMDNFGYLGDSEKTFADDKWRPLRPVAHAVVAFLFWSRFPDTLHGMWDCMHDAKQLRKVVLVSQIMRDTIRETPKFKRYKLKDADTVKFVLKLQQPG